MQFTFYHNNFNVLDLEKSLNFYAAALGLKETRRITADDGSFIIVYLGDGKNTHFLELTWLRDRIEPYNLGDNEFHLALHTDDYAAALKKHQEMGCVCYINEEMGIYFINDPDGYWIEILPPNTAATSNAGVSAPIINSETEKLPDKVANAFALRSIAVLATLILTFERPVIPPNAFASSVPIFTGIVRLLIPVQP